MLERTNNNNKPKPKIKQKTQLWSYSILPVEMDFDYTFAFWCTACGLCWLNKQMKFHFNKWNWIFMIINYSWHYEGAGMFLNCEIGRINVHKLVLKASEWDNSILRRRTTMTLGVRRIFFSLFECLSHIWPWVSTSFAWASTSSFWR